LIKRLKCSLGVFVCCFFFAGDEGKSEILLFIFALRSGSNIPQRLSLPPVATAIYECFIGDYHFQVGVKEKEAKRRVEIKLIMV
jgi:hypothetical protein